CPTAGDTILLAGAEYTPPGAPHITISKPTNTGPGAAPRAPNLGKGISTSSAVSGNPDTFDVGAGGERAGPGAVSRAQRGGGGRGGGAGQPGRDGAWYAERRSRSAGPDADRDEHAGERCGDGLELVHDGAEHDDEREPGGLERDGSVGDGVVEQRHDLEQSGW